MRKLSASIKKEALLIGRDIEGILLVFLMPLFLVIVITLLQHRTFQTVHESKIPLIIIDYDNDSLGTSFRVGMKKTEIFEITEITASNENALEQARKAVAAGKFQLGIFIPEGSTERLRNRAVSLIQNQLPGTVISEDDNKKTTEIQLFFDPITKPSFRNLAKSQFNEFAAKTEAKFIYQTYSSVIDALTNQSTPFNFPENDVILFKEDLVSEYTAGILPNAVQHNVPAWTLFGMFLICIPIAGNIIKERNDGCLARLKTMPINYLTIIGGKSVVYLIILMLQALLILLVGVFIMPLLGLPKLIIPNNWMALTLITLSSAAAATGYGIAIGTIAITQVQASTFGSISTVILAAIGGVWIPVLVMPDLMRKISEVSPMNWGIQGYYGVFLRNNDLTGILPSILKLLFFYVFCTILSIGFRKYHTKS